MVCLGVVAKWMLYALSLPPLVLDLLKPIIACKDGYVLHFDTCFESTSRCVVSLRCVLVCLMLLPNQINRV